MTFAADQHSKPQRCAMLNPSELDHLNRQVLALVDYFAQRCEGTEHSLVHISSGVPATGSNRKTTRILHRLMALARRRRHPVLARPLADASDRDIDPVLDRAGLTRADLFTPARAIAKHRVYMAYMLAARRIDVVRATAEHWEELKLADRACSVCRGRGRCRRWLEWGGPPEAPSFFCPNAPLFEGIAAEQASRAHAQSAGTAERPHTD